LENQDAKWIKVAQVRREWLILVNRALNFGSNFEIRQRVLFISGANMN
jgi:hypothetical protein